MTNSKKGYIVEATEKIILQGEDVVLDSPTDGQFIKRIAGVWKNGEGGEGSAAVESLIWDPETGQLKWVIGGSVSGNQVLDGRYPVIGGGGYYTQSEVNNLLVGSQTVVFKVSLPNGSTVSNRISGTIEGVDYPTGWVLTAGASPIDLNIAHGLGRRIASVTIFAVTGTQEQQLFGTSAYNGIITEDSNTLRIQSLATIAKAIKIYIVFV